MTTAPCKALIWLYDKHGDGVSFVCKFPADHPNHTGGGAHPHEYQP